MPNGGVGRPRTTWHVAGNTPSNALVFLSWGTIVPGEALRVLLLGGLGSNQLCEYLEALVAFHHAMKAATSEQADSDMAA
jgi:hypothetical protein